MIRAALALFAVLVSGCIKPDPFFCQSNETCGANGTCESTGYCSFVDDTCHTGRRYGEHAPADLSKQCVGEAGAGTIEITAGAHHSCARDERGMAWCWGGNAYGALGNHSFVDSTEPVPVAELGMAKAIAAGGDHTCAIDELGAVWCWGRNDFGQLGDGTFETRSVPMAVPRIRDAVELALGKHHSCVRTAAGDLYCWGDNQHGQLGGFGTLIKNNVPEPVNGLAGATFIAAGGDNTCASLNDGTVWCWGRNNHGQLITGDWNDSFIPVRMDGFGDVEQLAVGADHICALRANTGQTWCAGRNDMGQLGDTSGDDDDGDSGDDDDDGDDDDGDEGGGSAGPIHITGLGRAMELAAGEQFSCARGQSGAVLCWGRNDSGQLGDGTQDSRSNPVRPVRLDRSAIAISAGAHHACAQTEDGCVWCWGKNDVGQLGSDTAAQSAAPEAVWLSCW